MGKGGFDMKKLVENNGKFAILTNPIGDEKFGFLHWDDLRFFDDKTEAIKFRDEKE